MKEIFLKYLEEKYPLDYLDFEYIFNDIGDNIINEDELKLILTEDNLSENVKDSINIIINILSDNVELSRYVEKYDGDEDLFKDDLYKY